MEETNQKQDLREVRIQKMNEIKSLGVEIYPDKYEKTHFCAEIKNMEDGKTDISLAGRILLFRSFGKLIFIQLKDQSGRVQLAFQKGNIGDLDFEIVEKKLDLGDFIGVKGEVFTTKHGEKTLLVKEFKFLGKALRPMPEKFHGVQDDDIVYRQRYLDLIMNEESMARFKLRSDLIKIIREYYWENGFYEVETSTLEHNATGAAAKPYKTHNNALDEDLVLRISFEFPHKKLLIGGFERVFEIGKAFRNEGIDPSHLPEHTHFEHYVAYWSYEENMKYLEGFVKHIIKKLNLPNIISIKDKFGNPKEVDFSKIFERVDYIELIKKDSGIDINKIKDEKTLREEIRKKGIQIEKMEEMGYTSLVDNIFKKVSRPYIIGPTFLFNYPKELKPLARSNNKNPENTDVFQLVINGWEIINGYSELVDPIEQKSRLDYQQEAQEKGDEEAFSQDDEYIESMEYGMPPISGMGFGIDRFLTLITGQENLRDLVLFPLMKSKKKEISKKDMEEIYRKKKIVVIADENQPQGVLANAIGQLGISIGGHSQQKLFETNILYDKDGKVHYTDCFYGMSNLAGNQEQMAKFVEMCYLEGIQIFDFSDIMRKAHTDEEMQKGYKEKNTLEIGYIAVGALIPKDFAKDFLDKLKKFGE